MRGHGSPYLQLHANDPIAWQNWDQQVIARAKKDNKLLFVSIGYFSCHWCHVMQRESFSDDKIANLMNAQFIPVKVDRELHPALDTYLIEFVQRTRGTAGWPLNVIITPGGYPVVGVTYLPKDRLSKLLKQMSQLWQEDKNRRRCENRKCLYPLVERHAPAELRRVRSGEVQGKLAQGRRACQAGRSQHFGAGTERRHAGRVG